MGSKGNMARYVAHAMPAISICSCRSVTIKVTLEQMSRPTTSTYDEGSSVLALQRKPDSVPAVTM